MDSPSLDLKMVLLAILATESQRRGQTSTADRFLVAAGHTACHAGWLNVARRCHQLVLRNNARHWLARYPSLPDAIRNTTETAPLFRHAEAICSLETAEHHVHQLGLQSLADQLLADPGPATLALLTANPWPSPDATVESD